MTVTVASYKIVVFLRNHISFRCVAAAPSDQFFSFDNNKSSTFRRFSMYNDYAV